MCAGEAEAVAQRRRQQPGAGGGADQGERRQLERDGGGAGALADDDVDAEVLHRHVEHLLGGPGHAVDLVEEEDLALLEGGEDRGEVAGVLDGGAAGDADRGAHLGRDDHREGGLAEAGGAGEQHVVGGGAARAGGLQHQVELLADLLLADELVQVLGAQGGLDGLVLAVGGRRRRAARRRRSSVASSQFMRLPRGRGRSGGSREVRCAVARRRPVAGAAGQRARFRVCRAALQQLADLRASPSAASACGVTAATASSASRVA